MENSKYYTPKIEEFCVGLEVEVNQIDSNWKSYGWEKEIVKKDFNFKLAFEYIGLYRVKYLDNIDIESFGFINIPTTGTQRFKKYVNLKQFEDGEWFDYYLLLSLRYFNDLPHITVKKIDIHTYEEEIESHDNVRSEYLFQGYVKNKYEFNKILKQIRLYGNTIESSEY